MKIKQIILCVSTILLFGCQPTSESPTSDPDGSNSSATVNTVKTQNMLYSSSLNRRITINVNATSLGNEELEFTSQPMSTNDACQVSDIEGLTFFAASSEVGECRFAYTVNAVGNKSNSAEGYARVGVSEQASTLKLLPNLSSTTMVGEELSIDLAAELEGEVSEDIILADYTVADDPILIGEGNVVADPESNTLRFTAGSEPGTSRIEYSMLSDDQLTVMLGSIDISVSDSENTPPAANNIDAGIIDKDFWLIVDLANAISDNDDPVTLQNVTAYDADVEILSDTTFRFRSSVGGNHEVAYTVSDDRGGYAVAQVYIEVKADFSDIQDWEDISIVDPIIGKEITFTAPITSKLADDNRIYYVETTTEDGSQGVKGAQIATMLIGEAKDYCYSRGARLPLLRELQLLMPDNLYQSHNWPGSKSYWTGNKTSLIGANIVDLINDIESTSEDAEYTTCVKLSAGVNDFSIKQLKEQSVDDSSNIETNTSRYIVATVVDPDGYPSPYHEVTIDNEDGTGGFGRRNMNTNSIKYTNENGEATTDYEFTSGYDDIITARLNKHDEGRAIGISLSKSGFDPTNPDDWNVAKIFGEVPLENYNPIISENGTKIGLGEYSQFLTSISKTPLIGNHLSIAFSLDRTGSKLEQGAINIVLQQVGSKAPDVNWDQCDIDVYGSCTWSSSSKMTAGIPQDDDRFLAFLFDYYYQEIRVSTIAGIDNDTKGELLNRLTPLLYYKIDIDGQFITIYQSTDKTFTEDELALTYNLKGSTIDTSKFYYFGLSGGADGTDGVLSAINYLDIQFSE